MFVYSTLFNLTTYEVILNSYQPELKNLCANF